MSRRSFLAAGSAAAAGAAGLMAGCGIPDMFGGPDTMAVTDVETLRAVAADSMDLAARYEGAISRSPNQATRLTPLRDAHREHAAAIGRSLGESPQPSAPGAAPSGSAGTGSAALKDLAAAERSAAERAAAACVQVAPHHAPLLGTVAAARASHAEALT